MARCDLCGKSCRKQCARCQKYFCAKHLLESGLCIDCDELGDNEAEDVIADALETHYVGDSVFDAYFDGEE